MAREKFEKRWAHFRDLVEHMFLEPGQSAPLGDVLWYPATDAYETEEEFVVRMDVAGVRREDVQILMENDVLQVRGIRDELCPRGPKRFHKMEISLGPFARAIRVPRRFAGSETEARYEAGILEIRLRARPAEAPRDIEIEAEES